MTAPRSAETLVQRFTSDPAALEELKHDPIEVLNRMKDQVVREHPRALEGDKWVYRIVVLALSLIAIASVIGAIVLAAKAQGGVANIPDVITALGSAAIGALAGLLAPSPRSSTSSN
jgi:predicted phage tail protein